MVLSKRERYIVIVMLAVVGLLLLDRIFFTPLLARKADLDKKVSAAQEQLDKDRKLIQTARRLQRTWDDRSGNSLKRVQAEADNQVYNKLLEWARGSRMTLTSTKSERVEKDKDFHKVTIRATGSGQMSEISRFLYDIQASKIPVRITDLGLTSKKEGVDDLTLNLGVTTIYLDPERLRPAAGTARENSP